MIVEVNPSARIQVRGVANLQHPGCCAVCGSGDIDRQYVDPALFVDFEGQYYFCNLCTEEMGSTIGMLTVDEARFLINQNNQFQARNVELEKVKLEYDRLTNALDSLGGSIAGNLGVISSDRIISPPEPEGLKGDPLSNDESTISGEKELSESIKSVAERGQLNDAPQPSGSDGLDQPNFRL